MKILILKRRIPQAGKEIVHKVIEEVILVDGQKLSEVIIPLMNVNRRAKCGDVDPNEPHKQQVYVTTAGYRNTFAYQKMVQLLIWMVFKGNAFVFGGDYRIPVMHKLLDGDFVEELKEDGTFNPLSFSREYGSIWSGASEDAFFDGDLIDRHRTVEKPEFEPEKNTKSIYIIATDVARLSGAQNADTVAMVIKATPRKNGTYTKQVVNMFVFNGEHFETQSIKLKRITFSYNASMLVVDANGLGVGLVDYLVKENTDEKTGEILPPFSVENDEEKRYVQYETKDSLPLLYNVKAGNGNSSDIYVNCLSQISSNKVKFLIDELTAKSNILASKEGKLIKENPEEMARLLAPHVATSIMKEEMLNLKQLREGKNVILKRINGKIGRDKFSALIYGLWYLKQEEDKNVVDRVDVDSDRFLMIKVPKKKFTVWR